MIRKTTLTSGESYHLFSRGTERRAIFCDDHDFMRFILSMELFNTKQNIAPDLVKDVLSGQKEIPRWNDQLVRINAFCLNTNHFHILATQVVENGISRWMQKIGTGYVMYFNKKYKRTGALFEGRFKSEHINSSEYLLHVSAYVNFNYIVHGFQDETNDYKWSSIAYYGKKNPTIRCGGKFLDDFNTLESYKKYGRGVACKTRNDRNARKEFE